MSSKNMKAYWRSVSPRSVLSRSVLPLALLLGGCASLSGGTGGSVQALSQQSELKQELKILRNKVEEMEFANETSKSRQHNLFQDLDRRLLALERALRLSGDSEFTAENVFGSSDDATDANTASSEQANIAPGGSVSVAEQQAYEKAFGLLKQSKYHDAITELQRFTKTYPKSQLADDAYYWMSEARYVNRETEAALNGFKTVTTRYPDSEKVPEALLKIGYIKYDIGAYKEAAKIFRDILVRFPTHEVAAPAQTRLLRIEQTIQ